MKEVQAQIIKYLFPRLTKGQARRLRMLSNEKHITYLDKSLQFNLTGLVASMVRHEQTAYDDIIGIVGKAEARSMIRSKVEGAIKRVSRK